MSKLDPLLDALKKTNADELCILAGERIFIMRGGRRQDIGRDPVQAAAVHGFASELLKPDEIRAVRNAQRTVRIAHGGDSLEVVFTFVNDSLGVAIRSRRPGGGAGKSRGEPMRACHPRLRRP